ncbi:MAG TPA: cytochrome d ubiquinol oxidase subunit II [Syntrophales bacterium]|nr:cytochrome d ubiquinol oxidase subunit II [Syntrophales bacterium]
MEWLEAHVVQIWFLIIGFFVLYYAVSDGYDLGVGMIALFCRDEDKRSIMMASLQSVWQDNQTWLVLLGGMLFGAFPLFYSVALSAFYIPIIIMLFGLIFRGIAFEYRDHSKRPYLWSLSFGIGSLVTALSQGFTMGGIFYGIPMEGHDFIGTIWSWFHPYSILFTLGVLSGYIMLGANYLIMKTSGVIQRRCVQYSYFAAISTLVISIAVYIWTIARHPYMARKWLAMPGLFNVATFPLLALAALVMYLRSLHKRSEVAPLLWNMIFVFCAFIGLSIGFYPYIIPNMVTIKSAAVSSSNTLIFMLAMIIILLPVILVYIGYKHWVFRGKVEEHGYED